MKLTKKTLNLICNLEHIVGSNCYNSRSHDGYTGEDGCYYRYPVYYEDDQYLRKTKTTILELKKEYVSTVCYKFGANELQIGTAIVEMLNYLETQYGLNFDELVKKNK